MKTSSLSSSHRLRKWLVRVSLLAGIIVGLLGVGLLLAPTLVSTSAGTRWVVGYVNQAIIGQVRITRMQWTWFGGQSIEGLELVDPSGQVVAGVGALTLPQTSLWQGLWGSHNLGAIQLDHVRANVVRNAQGRYNLADLLASPASASTPGSGPASTSGHRASTGSMSWGGWSVRLRWNDVKMTFAAPGMEPLELTSPVGSVDMRSPRDMALDFTAALTQGQATSQVVAKGAVHDLFGPAGKMTLDQARGDITVSAIDFPLQALDRLMNWKGRLVTLLGPTLQANLTASGSARAMDIGLHAQSDQLTAQVNLLASADALTLKQPGQGKLVVTPKAWSTWWPQATLATPMTIAMTLDQLTIPMQGRHLVVQDAAAALQATLSGSRLHLPDGSAITLDQMHVQLHVDPLSQQVQVKVDSRVGMGEQRPAKLTASVAAELNGGLSQFDKANLTADVDVVDFPVAWVDQQKLTAWKWLPILGPTVSIHGKANVPGDLSFNAKSNTASLSGRLGLAGDHQLVLRDDLVATLRITPLMARSFLGAMHPMFRDAVQSQTPVRMVVNASDKPIPLSGMKIEDIQLSGTLDGGTVLMRRGGWMNESLLSLNHAILDVVHLRGTDATRPEHLNTYPATFTPMSWKLDQGIFDASETWVTSSDLALGFVGSVDLRDPANPLIRKMVMGVLQASLVMENPGLRRFIEPDQIAELPLSGPLNQPVVDRGIFMQDMIGSFAVQTTRENLGQLGDLLGGLIQDVGGAIKKDRQKAMGITWHPPPAALALIEKTRQMDQPKPPGEVR